MLLGGILEAIGVGTAGLVAYLEKSNPEYGLNGRDVKNKMKAILKWTLLLAGMVALGATGAAVLDPYLFPVP